MLTPALNAVSTLLSEQHRPGMMLYLSSLLAVVLFVRRLRQWRRLSHVPGPPLAGLSRLFWLVPMARSGDVPSWMLDVERRYGKDLAVPPK